MLKLSYLDDHKWASTILINGNSTDLLLFVEFLDFWSKNPHEISLSELEFLALEDPLAVEINISVDSGPVGMRATVDKNLDYSWFLQPDLARNFSNLVKGVSESEISSHAYLDATDDDVAVMVSKGEYS